MSESTTTVKKTTRARKTSVSADSSPMAKPDALIKSIKTYEESFVNLLNTISISKEEFSFLQKEITGARETWVKEQQDHEREVVERNQQEEVARKREAETYTYEAALIRKKAEDEFLERKAKWEKELTSKKEELQEDKEELESLRKQVLGFDAQIARAVKEATDMLKQDITDAFITEKKMREQEVKAEKELLGLKITNFTQENSRLTSEVALLKKSLEEATSQLKEVAVKVIESSNSSLKIPQVQNP